MASELLEEVGLLSHTIVFLVFMKFLASHVMNNSPPLLRQYLDLKYSRVLSQINSKEMSESLVVGWEDELRVGPEKTQLLERVRIEQEERSQTQATNTYTLQSSGIMGMREYQLWLVVGKELLKKGRLSQA